MKIALVYPPTSELDLKGYPLGLAYLSAALKRDHDVAVYNYSGDRFHASIRRFLQAVKTTRPGLVGISFNSFNRWGAFQIIRAVKRIDPRIHLVLGGVHPATLYEQMFAFFPEVDFVLLSEGEHSLPALAGALEGRGALENVGGLVRRGEGGRLAVNPTGAFVKDLDDLPFPDYSYAADEIKAKGIAYLISSRGCPVNCSFCSTSSFWGQNVRVNSPERIVREVEYVKSLGARRVFFHDDTFNLGIPRTIRIARQLKPLGIEYAIQCRVTPVSGEMIEALVDSGCRHITWGVESLSEKILKNIHKNITREMVVKAFDLSAPYADRLTTSGFFCVGTPGETEETIRETIAFANAHLRSTHGAGASMLYILPGTKIYRDLVAAGRFDERKWVRSGHVYYYTGEHTMMTLNRWRKMVNGSGTIIPHQGPGFWDAVPSGGKEPRLLGSRALGRVVRKTSRQVNLFLGRY